MATRIMDLNNLYLVLRSEDLAPTLIVSEKEAMASQGDPGYIYEALYTPKEVSRICKKYPKLRIIR